MCLPERIIRFGDAPQVTGLPIHPVSPAEPYLDLFHQRLPVREVSPI
jgi:hypothetical protein